MTQNDTNILVVLNLLVVLFRANKQKIAKLHDEELYTFTIKKEFYKTTVSLFLFSQTHSKFLRTKAICLVSRITKYIISLALLIY